MNQTDNESNRTGLEIAVIGMSGRFPGAAGIDRFWENLEQGVEAISFFSQPELEEAGVPAELAGNPDYVKGKGFLEDAEYFDSVFFEYLPAEAEVMDPQMRLFHQCAWAALEDAAYDPWTYPGFIGVYAGASTSMNWQALSMLTGSGQAIDHFSSNQLRDKDFMTTRLSYKLNLKGPAFTMSTACSTSLVAVNLACQGMLSGECDMALAGGVTLAMPQRSGNIYREGMIGSPDGHCRAFDSRSQGTVSGSGVGVVVLKLLEQALEDRDHIYAIIKGSATNNDGLRKAGYTAPSIDGQAEVIKTAMQLAEVEPESISYVETHGTATALGDPVEMAALKLAFETEKRNYCAVGSVKSNIGHLDSAAGVAGLVKAVLALKHKLIPPSLHFESPNPEIDFAHSPFYVNNELRQWTHNGPYPRRACVSSFGIGGTNAHVVLEEYKSEIQTRSSKVFAGVQGGAFLKKPPWSPKAEGQIVLLSAKSKTALDRMTANLADYFKKNPGIDLGDAAYTLQVGRAAFKRRRMLCCSGPAEAAELLNPPDPDLVKSFKVRKEDRPVIFMFSGQGSQYVNMGRGLYESQPLFKKIMDECFGILKTTLGLDLKDIIYPQEPGPTSVPLMDENLVLYEDSNPPRPYGAPLQGRGLSESTQIGLRAHPLLRRGGREADGVGLIAAVGRAKSSVSSVSSVVKNINSTAIAQPVIFMIEYALAKLLMSWGIEPKAMTGHSIGEYAAACLSGVFSLADALRLVANRGRLMQGMPAGSMLSVPLSETETVRLLKDKELSLAAVNSSKQCVVSGSHEAVEAFAKELESSGTKTRRLHTSHAFHSPMMEPILEEFKNTAAGITFNEPGIPFISNVTGARITGAEATDPAYWARQIRGTVRFAHGLSELLQDEHALFLEVGPGKALCTFVRQHEDKKNGQHTVNLIRHAKEEDGDLPYLLNRVGQCWLYGAAIDWQKFHGDAERSRVSLPTYAFDERPFLAEGDPFALLMGQMAGGPSLRRKPDMADWFYVPSWERSQAAEEGGDENERSSPWLIFMDDSGRAGHLIEELKRRKESYVLVRPGSAFKCAAPGEYLLNPAEPGDYDSLLNELKGSKQTPGHIAHFWTVTGEGTAEPDPATIDRSQDQGFFSLFYLVQAMGRQEMTGDIRLAVVSDGLHRVTGEEEQLCPGKSTLLSAVKIVPLEYPNMECKSIDIPARGLTPEQTTLLLQELGGDYSRNVVAVRGDFAWAPVWKARRMSMEESRKSGRRLREKGVYLITGGMGGMGFTLAEYLAEHWKSRLILIGRSPFPARGEWDSWLKEQGAEDKVSLKIKKIRQWEEKGAEIMIESADISDLPQVREIVDRALRRFGAIDGVVHSAGVADYHGIIARRTREQTGAVMASKVKGTLVLDRALRDVRLDFFVLFSSISSVLYKSKFGEIAYNAANEFLDAYAYYKSCKTGTFVTVVNWCGWREVGMAVEALKRQGNGEVDARLVEALAEGDVTPAQGVALFNRILDSDQVQVSVTPQDLDALLTHLENSGGVEPAPGPGPHTAASPIPSYGLQDRPDLSSEYAAPTGDLEKKLTVNWQEFFGIDLIGINDDFFELGGDSLKAMLLTAKIHKEFNIRITLANIFRLPTIRKLSQHMEEAGEDKLSTIDPVEKKSHYVLSANQERLWFIHQRDPRSPAYNMADIIELSHAVNHVPLKKAMAELCRRHESLRTAFTMNGDEPAQVIADGISEPPFREIDISHCRESEKQQELGRVFQDESGRVFDLSKAPLIRFLLVRLAEDHYAYMFVMHHIISDGWSMELLKKELNHLYEAYLTGQPVALDPLRLRYRDFTIWHKRFAVGEGARSGSHRFWKQKIEQGIPRLQLPANVEADSRDVTGAMYRYLISPDLQVKLKRLSRESNTTLFMVMFALYLIALSRYSNREDIICSIISAGREHQSFHPVIGFFVNSILFTIRVDPEEGFAKFLRRVSGEAEECLLHQGYPLEILFREMKKRYPDIPVAFNMTNLPGGRETTALESYESVHSDGQDVKFDIEPYISEYKNGIDIRWAYRKNMFSARTIEYFVRDYVKLMEFFTAAPQKSCREFNTAGKKKRKKLTIR